MDQTTLGTYNTLVELEAFVGLNVVDRHSCVLRVPNKDLPIDRCYTVCDHEILSDLPTVWFLSWGQHMTMDSHGTRNIVTGDRNYLL